MNPDTGDEPEDWFARFEREAREAAQRREQEEAEAAAPTPPVTPPSAEAPAAPPPVAAPQLANPFDAPAATPLQPTPPPVWEPEPTQAIPAPLVEPEPTQAIPAAALVEPEATQAMPAATGYGAEPPAAEPTQALERAPLRPPGAEEPGSPLDSLFGDDSFRDYDSSLGPDPSNAPWANRGRSKELVPVAPAGGGDGTPPPPRSLSTLQKALLGAGGGILAVLALVALFLAGTRLPDLLGPAPAVSTPMPTPTPTMTVLPIGPVDPGAHLWSELLGGECLEPFEDAWQVEYTVVNCAEPHGGQLVLRAWFADKDADPAVPWVGKPDDPFPGAEALKAQIGILCSAAGVYDVAAASAYTDAAIQGAYPVTAEQWEEDPSYYCFVSRSSGEPLTGTLAIPRQPSP